MLTAAHSALDAMVPASTRGALCDQIEALARLEAHSAERRLAVTAAIDALDDDGLDGCGVNRSVGRCSGRRAAQLAATAAAFAEMPGARSALRDGAITGEHADALARAADDIDARSVQAELVTVARSMPADLFARRTRDWVARRQAPADVDANHAAQRAGRSCRTWTDRHGIFWLLLNTDAVSGAEIAKAIDHRVDQLWRADGGRDGTPNEIRTPDQRRADAVHELVCATGATEATARPGRHPRHHMFVTADLTRLRLDNPEGAAIVDGRPLPQPVLERLACDAAITPILFGGDSEILWQGRAVRSATPAQWKGLIARDGGCTVCGVDPARCEAHHIVPWIDLGPTDITNLALVCPHDHHWLHDNDLVLVRTSAGWEIRPRAGPDHTLAA